MEISKQGLSRQGALPLARLPAKHGQIPVKLCSRHINADNCWYSHKVCKSEKPDFYPYPQMFGDVSQKFEDMQSFAEFCGY